VAGGADTAAREGLLDDQADDRGIVLVSAARQPRTFANAEPADQMCAAIVTLVWDDYMSTSRCSPLTGWCTGSRGSAFAG